MSMTSRPLHDVEVAALARVRGAWFYLVATHGELILDYAAHDPSYDPSEWEQDPLGGLLQVRPKHGLRYLANLDDRVYPVEMIPDFVALNGDRAQPVATIDFDSASFVSSYYDQALETLCGDAWHGEFGDPLRKVPPSIRNAFAR